MTDAFVFDSLAMLNEPLDLLGRRSLTQEEEEACVTVAERMREFAAKMPPVILAAALPPKQTLEPVDFMFAFYSLPKESQKLIIERSKQREPLHLKSIFHHL